MIKAAREKKEKITLTGLLRRISTETVCPGGTTSPLKRLSLLTVAILVFSVLAVSFHYHDNFSDRPDCQLCKFSKSLSSSKRPTPALLSGHICKTFLDPAIAAQPAPLLAPMPAGTRRALAQENRTCHKSVVTSPVGSRASPSVIPCRIA